MQELRAGSLLAEPGQWFQEGPSPGADAEPLLGCKGQTHCTTKDHFESWESKTQDFFFHTISFLCQEPCCVHLHSVCCVV